MNMHCPFCDKTVTANPQDYTINKDTVEVKVYKCINCNFEWLPFCEERKIHDAYSKRD